VDGNSSTSLPAKSCTHTDTENRPWWRVDLGKEEQVSEVYIVNRDGDGQSLSNFEIRVGMSPFFILLFTFKCIKAITVYFFIVPAICKKQKNYNSDINF